MAQSHEDDRLLPETPIDSLVAPMTRFLHVEQAGGIVLLATSFIAICIANSPWGGDFEAFFRAPTGVEFGSVEIIHSLKHWISDGLMAVFFFVIGLEVKREIVLGELREPRQAVLPLVAAVGGMVVPAATYLFLMQGLPGQSGWGIPMATDIAFVIGCLAILGDRAPASLRVFLVSLAIADDIGAILVIAVGYTESVHVTPLLVAAAALAVVFAMSRLGVRAVPLYVMVGAVVWLGFHESGVHATIAGVLLGLATPAESWVGRTELARGLERFASVLEGDWRETGVSREQAFELKRAVRESFSPLERLETKLHPWTSFFILPLFAFANAGVAVEPSAFAEPVAVAVGVGLVLGKPIGVVAFCWLAVRFGLAKLPSGVTWSVLAGAGLLAGIGFTMSLFIAGLALEGELVDAAKIGVLLGSLVAGAAGMALLVYTGGRSARAPQREPV